MLATWKKRNYIEPLGNEDEQGKQQYTKTAAYLKSR
jgi:hypothetical protein